jgi:SAM-dependent methyltransferase
MANQVEERSYGRVFDEVADEYDRHRPAYPDALIDHVCEVAGLTPGADVMEIGCGTGQLTRSLLVRGLHVTAVEPGEKLLARAREQLDGVGEVEFVHARLEDAALPPTSYRAVFSAAAIHWVDPDVSWRKLHDAVTEHGTLALLSHLGLDDPHTADDLRELRAALERVAPERAAAWPTYRDLDRTLAGVAQRRGNVSEAWAWLACCDVARDYAADLFEDAQLVVVPSVVEHTADELNALLGTMSFWARLSPAQRDALKAENQGIEDRLGRAIRSTTAVCLVTAQRRPPT